MGHFSYSVKGGNCKGYFDLHQAKNGAIYMVMGSRSTKLNKEQIEDDLRIDIFDLEDFDHTAYINQYHMKEDQGEEEVILEKNGEKQ